MLDAFGSKDTDNSVRINQYTDSFNQTRSWAQAVSDLNNTTVNVNKPSGAVLETLMPVLLVGVAVVGLVAVLRKS